MGLGVATKIDEKVEGEVKRRFSAMVASHVFCVKKEAHATTAGTHVNIGGSVNHELKVGAAYAVLAIMLDVLCPRFALHVDEDSPLGT